MGTAICYRCKRAGLAEIRHGDVCPLEGVSENLNAPDPGPLDDEEMLVLTPEVLAGGSPSGTSVLEELRARVKALEDAFAVAAPSRKAYMREYMRKWRAK